MDFAKRIKGGMAIKNGWLSIKGGGFNPFGHYDMFINFCNLCFNSYLSAIFLSLLK